MIVVTIGGLALDVARHPTPVKDLEDATVALTKSLEARGAPRQPVLTRFDTDSGAQLQRGVFDALARAGFPVRVDPDLAYEFGDQFAATPDDVGAVWWFADSGVPLIELGGLPGAKVIASYSPLSASEEAEARGLQRQLYDTLVAAGRADLAPQLDGRFVDVALRDVPGIDQQATERLAALNQAVYDQGSCRCGVVALPPQGAPVTVRDISAAAADSASG